nr:NHL repeat-containing protein [uncultured bacterium]
MTVRPLLLPFVLACALAGQACNTGRPTAAAARKPSTAPANVLATAAPPTVRAIAQLGEPLTLTGKVKIISDNGGGLISNNSGSVIGNNGGSLVSNNGSGLKLLAGAPAREALLVDAVVTIHDAAGRMLLDADGRPLAATTDGQGGYSLRAVLPAESLVLRVKLWQGGELAAMLPHQAGATRTMPIDTASTLGATYVLRRFVQGDQAIYDRLPASEAARLRAQLLAAGGAPTTAPKYQPDELLATVERLSAAAGVRDALADIKALLLGQANLGGGRKATDVPLQSVLTIAVAPNGHVYLGEAVLGRIRDVAPDGTLTNLADANFGKVKRTFSGMRDLAVGPDGSVYVALRSRIVRIAPDGTMSDVAGDGYEVETELGRPARETGLDANRIAVAPDGTLYIAESGSSRTTPRLLKVGSDGIMRQHTPTPWGPGHVDGLCFAADGNLDVLCVAVRSTVTGELYRLAPDGRSQQLASGLEVDAGNWLARGTDGTYYVSQGSRPCVVALGPGGDRRAVAGIGATSPGRELADVGAIAAGPDGSLFIVERAAGKVHRLGADDSWTTFAGTSATTQVGDVLAINTPSGLTWDEQGRLIVTEDGSHTLRRFDGKTFEVIAGTPRGAGFDGETGPALSQRLKTPTGIIHHAGATYLLDAGNWRVRKLGADGQLTTLVGPPAEGAAERPTKGKPVPARRHKVANGMGLAVSPAGRIYWTDSSAHEVNRLSLDGRHVELVAGGGASAGPLGQGSGDGGPAADCTLCFPTGLAFSANGDLYVSDTGNLRVRRITGLDGPEPRIEAVAGVQMIQALERLGQPEAPGEDNLPAGSTILGLPFGLVFDANDNLYMTEIGSATFSRLSAKFGGGGDLFGPSIRSMPARVRRLGPDGELSIIAGPGGRFFADETDTDMLVGPADMRIDPQGRLVILDVMANQIRFLPAGSF